MPVIETTYREALRQSLIDAMNEDPSIIIMGEEVGRYGGAYGVTKGMLEMFGENRVIDTPISEPGIVGAGIGAAMTGLRPVVELMYVDFAGLTMDQMANQAAKSRYMFGGQIGVPMVLRSQGGTGRSGAAQHSQSLESWFTHVPGLRVVMPATAEDAAELLSQNPIVEKTTLYVAISQSGETGDTLQTLREIRLRGGLIAGITNVPGSSLSRETDFGIYIHAGPEISVSSTKAFTAQILATELLALRFARLRDLGASEGRAWVNGLAQLPALVRVMLEQAPACKALAERFHRAPFTMYVGRGGCVPIAAEGALKLKEIAYLPAEGLSGAAMKHGPLALIQPGTPVWALVPPDDTRERMLGNLRELAARGAYLMAVADRDDHEVAKIAQHMIPLPPHHAAVAPILSVIPLQLYAYHAALASGHDIDKPRNLAKSVTVT